MNDRIAMPELSELEAVLGREVALLLSPAAGGWRTLSLRELEALGLPPSTRHQVQSLQRLTDRPTPALPLGVMASADDVGRVYSERIGALEHEVVLALALDSQNRVIQELELARGGKHGAALVPGDVFRPLMRAGASAGLFIHNHPSGSCHPSPEDVAMTRAVAVVGEIVGIHILDHVIVCRSDWTSLLELGVFDHLQEKCA